MINVRSTTSFTLIFTAYLLAGCDPRTNGSADAPESVESQQLKIEATVQRISDMSARWGTRQQFTRIPIVIDFDPSSDRPAGYCQVKNNEKVIGIHTRVLKNKDVSLRTAVLLHEIGHCYFNRPHFETRLRNREGRAVHTIRHADRLQMSIWQEGICASIMCAKMPPWPAELHEGFLQYYVGELLGHPRAQRLEDLSRYVPQGQTLI